MKKILLLAFVLTFSTVGNSQQRLLIPPVQWFSFEDALTLNAQRVAYGLQPRKIFIDVYTVWCGWCRRFNEVTLSHPVIADILNTEWIPVKLNAERTDTVVINNQVFVNENPGVQRSSHQLAQVLLQGRMGFPTQVFIDERGNTIQISPGFKQPAHLEALLRFFGTNSHQTMEFEAFLETFHGVIRIEQQ